MDDQDISINEIPDGAEVDMSLMGTDRHVVLEWSAEVVSQFDDGRGNSLAPTVATPKGAGRALHPYKSNGISPFRCKKYPGGAFGMRVAPAYTEKFDDVVKHHDEQWDRQYRALRQYKEEHRHCVVPKRYPPNKTLGTWVDTQRQAHRKKKEGKQSQITPERIQKLEEIGFVWNVREADWLEMYNELVEFEKKHHRCVVPKRYPPNKTLGTWVDKQRTQHRKKKEGKQSQITPVRIQKLEEIGFVWNVREADWLEMYNEIVEFEKKHHRCVVPKRYPPNKTLGTWVDKQRTQHRKKKEGKQSQITPVRIQKLEEIGFVWNVREADWLEMYNELVEFEKKHHHCVVPKRYPPNKTLGTWVDTQRQECRKKKKGKPSFMTPERIQKLEEIGFVWNVREADWLEMYNELVEYKEEHHHCVVPKRYPPNKTLGTWVDTQRQECRKKKKGKPSSMTPGRIQKLEEIGFVWNVREADWLEMYNELVEYKEEHHHCVVPKRYPPNKTLGTWVITQRKEYRKKKEGKPSSMTPGRIQKLEEIGFAWNVRKNKV